MGKMGKDIMGRLVEWDVKEKKIWIHNNDNDIERYDETEEELGYVDRSGNADIIANYFSNARFREIHDEVFPSGYSWEMDSWNDEDRAAYLGVLVQHPCDDTDE